jgi:hypothetical protein
LVEPTASVDVVNVAFPPLSCPVPSTIFPAIKVTGPVGLTVGDVMVAVKVTACPDVDGFGDEVSVAELVASVTTWFTTEDVLLRLFASPL